MMIQELILFIQHLQNMSYDDHAFMVKSEGVGIKGEFEKKF